MSYSWTPRAAYNFSVLPSTILGSNWQNVTVLGTVTPDVARNFIDIYAKHQQCYPFFSKYAEDDATSYDYIIVESASGVKTALGMPWIDESTIQVVSANTITIVMSNVTSNDLSKVKAMMTAYGYTAYSATLNTIVASS